MINLHDQAITQLLPQVGPKAFAVLLVICKHLNRKNTAFPSKLTIMKLTNMGRDAVTRELDALEQAGLLKKEQRNNGGKFSTNLYTVTTNLIGVYIPANDAGEMEDSPCTESPYTESPYTESPYTESPYTESPYTESQATISIKQTGSIKQVVSIKQEQERAPEKIDFVTVANLMEQHVNGEGKDQWEAMCKASGYKGKPITVFMNWAGKANDYQLRNWKAEIPRLLTWMRNEARADYVTEKKVQGYQPAQPQPAPNTTRIHRKNHVS